MTREAVIVEVKRTPVGRAYKGSLKDVRPDDLAAFAVRALLDELPGLDPASIDDLVCGCAFPWGEQGYNVGRNVAVLAGLPHTVPGCTVTRLCASSLQALRMAAHAVMLGEGDTFLVVGVESVSRVGRGHDLAPPNPKLDPDSEGPLLGAVFMPMGVTAENVAERYGVTRERMDAFAQRSQERAVAASHVQDARAFLDHLGNQPVIGPGAIQITVVHTLHVALVVGSKPFMCGRHHETALAFLMSRGSFGKTASSDSPPMGDRLLGQAPRPNRSSRACPIFHGQPGHASELPAICRNQRG